MAVVGVRPSFRVVADRNEDEGLGIEAGFGVVNFGRATNLEGLR